MSFSWIDRQNAFQWLHNSLREVLILGGGVVGCSIAAHLAMLGVQTVLVEREDLASGASGHSTGLAHAGLRYLAQGRLSYVFHESRERQRLEEMAPHWVRPFRFLLPVYRQDPYPFWQVRLGTWLYDLFGWIDAGLTGRPFKPRHRARDVEELRARIPGLQSEGLRGGVEYFVDARLQDSRFTLGWAQLAAQHGARIITYAEVHGCDYRVEGVQSLIGVDRLTGEKVSFRASLVINATGAWIDETRKQAGLTQEAIIPSQGIHLIVDQVAGTPLIFNTEQKGRVFFIIPMGTDASLIGTTDTLVRGPVDQAGPEPREMEELIRRLFRFFPYFKQGTHLREAIELFKQVHVRDVFWGVRPLLRQAGETFRVSREHRLMRESPTFWSIPGVKLTAARAVGREVAKAAWKAVREVRCPKLPSRPLPGGDIADYDRYVLEAQRRFKWGEGSDEVIAYLVSMYGTNYLKVLALAEQEPDYGERLLPDEPWLPAEAAYAAEEEMVVTLNDFLWRRTKWAHLRELPEAALDRIVNALAGPLHWSAADREAQIAGYHEERKRHRLNAQE